MKRIFLVILALVLVLTLFSCDDNTTVQSGDDTSSQITQTTLLSQNKRVQASKEANGTKVNRAFDGESSTYWSNGPCNAAVSEWIPVDLGEHVDLSTAKAVWGACRAVDYKIEISRGGAQYQTAYEVTGGVGKEDTITFEEGTVARYLKISMTKADAATSSLVGIALCEFEVYGIPSEDQTLGSETEKITGTKVVPFTETNTFVTNKSYEFNYLRWDGSELDFKTTGGTVIGIVVEGTDDKEVQLDYSIDGSEFKKVIIQSGEGEYILEENLEDKPHEVRIIRDTQARVKGVTVKSAIIEDTAKLEEGYTREFSCKIQILGDSITAGGLEYFTNTYGFKMSEQINAQTIYTAVSGGLVHYIKDGDNIIPEMFKATEFGGEEDYNFEYQPDILLLSSGVNDRNPWKDNHDSAFRAQFEVDMQKTYFEFFCFIHEKMPNTKILYSTSAGMVAIDPVDRIVTKAIAQAKEKYPDLVIEKIFMEEKIDVNQLDPALWHPGEQTHDRDSYIYAAKVKEMLGLK